MKKILILLLVLFLSGCSLPWKKKKQIAPVVPQVVISSSTPFYYDITAKEAKEMIAAHSDLVVMNATTSNLDKMTFVSKGNIDGVSKNLDKNVFLLVYSYDEGLGMEIASRLSELGFNHVYRLERGVISWDQASSSWLVTI